VLAPATLAALPSTRAISQTRVFYVARPTRSIRKKLAASRRKVVSRSLPATLDRYPHGVTGHVARPTRSIRACEPLSSSFAIEDKDVWHALIHEVPGHNQGLEVGRDGYLASFHNLAFDFFG
jgi:hypothetical protein